MKANWIVAKLLFIIFLFMSVSLSGQHGQMDISSSKATWINDFNGNEVDHFSTQISHDDDSPKYQTHKCEPLDASDYHQLRGGLRNSFTKFEHEKTGRIAFLGGSITYNSGWRDSICEYFQTRFPETEFDFIPAGIPSMGSTPSAFRLERDILSAGKIDLILQEAAVNDAVNGRTPDEQIRAMEGIVRHLRMSNPDIDIIIMHFADPDKIEDYNKGIEPEVIMNHNLVAEHYQIPAINLAKEVADRINNGEFSWKDDFRDLHPSPFGQGIYARSIICFLSGIYPDQFYSGEKLSSHKLPDKIDKFAYDQGSLVDIDAAILSEGWSIDKSWNPKDGTNTRPGFVDVPMLVSDNPGSLIKLNFKGSVIGIVVAAGDDAGVIEYRIDEKDWIELNLFTKWSRQLHLPWYYILSDELSDNEHLLEIRISATKDSQSNGTACRIRHFFINSI